MALLLNGKIIRDKIAAKLRERISALSSKPKLVIIQISSRAESNAYIEQKKLFGESIGARVLHIALPESVSESEIRSRIQGLNADESVHGVILQLPIPPQLNKQKLLDAITPQKDVDGLTSAQGAARGAGKTNAVTPATARGVLELLRFYQIPIQGKKAAVLGRSALVGAPTAEALRNAGAEVTVCHSKTPNIKEITKTSDIVVVAIGKPRLIGAEYFRGDKTQTVVDVGITAITEKGEIKLEEEIPKKYLVGLNRPEGSVGPRAASPGLARTNLKRFVIGDVDFESVKEMVSAISPVPGGVGPMTVAALFENLVSAYEIQTASG